MCGFSQKTVKFGNQTFYAPNILLVEMLLRNAQYVSDSENAAFAHREVILIANILETYWLLFQEKTGKRNAIIRKMKKVASGKIGLLTRIKFALERLWRRLVTWNQLDAQRDAWRKGYDDGVNHGKMIGAYLSRDDDDDEDGEPDDKCEESQPQANIDSKQS